MHRHNALFIQTILLALLLVAISSTPVAAQAASDYLHWYLPEGAQNAVFDEEILIANPTAQNAQVTVTLLPEPGAGSETSVPIAVGAHSRYTLRLAQFFPGNINGAVSARIDSTNNVPIVVERSMYWANGQRGAGHNAVGLTGLSTRWELAEGASGFWETFILLVNPNDVPATVTLTFLPAAGGAPQSMRRVVQPHSRTTVWVNGQADVPPAFRNAQFSTTITSDQPIAVERAMYWNGFAGGTDSTATRTAAQTWYFGEGATSGNASLQFETFLLLENPNAQATTVRLSFFKDGGGVVQRDFPVAAKTRRTVSARLDVPELGATGFSTTVQSLNPNLPIVAERAMYWLLNGSPVPADGHTVQGARGLWPSWAFAEGIQGSLRGVPAGPYDTFFLISNPHASALQLTVHVVRGDGTGAVHPLTVPPRSRYTLYMGAMDANGRPLYPEAANQRFATTIRSVGGSPLPFLAERAVYWGGLDGGHASAGVPWGTLSVGTPAPVPPPEVSSVAPGTGRLSGGTRVTIRGRGFQPGARVTVGGAAATSVRVIDDATIVALTPAAPNKRTGSAAVSVINADGKGSIGSATFTYNFHVLAFGDSITAGATSFRNCDFDDGCRIQSVRAMTPYPAGLLQRLADDPRFATGLVIRNRGIGGECASRANCGSNSGETRFAGALEEDPDYDFVVLLEGVNDLTQPDQATAIERAHDALRDMVRQAKARAKVVVICKLTPVEDDEITGEPRRDLGSVAQLNSRIEDLTLEEGLYRISWSGIDISADGLHPTQNGYNAMAQQVYDKIIQILGP
ncbi:MAG: GDSL-type esterase/lipase family protein [Vicinamibacteraceae bacterium]